VHVRYTEQPADAVREIIAVYFVIIVKNT